MTKGRDSIIKTPFLWRKITGHSMLPVLPPGTHIVGYTWFRQLREEQVAIVEIEGREKVKRISKISNNSYLVEDDHKNGNSSDNWVERSDIKAVVIWPRAHKP